MSSSSSDINTNPTNTTAPTTTTTPTVVASNPTTNNNNNNNVTTNVIDNNTTTNVYSTGDATTSTSPPRRPTTTTTTTPPLSLTTVPSSSSSPPRRSPTKTTTEGGINNNISSSSSSSSWNPNNNITTTTSSSNSPPPPPPPPSIQPPTIDVPVIIGQQQPPPPVLVQQPTKILPPSIKRSVNSDDNNTINNVLSSLSSTTSSTSVLLPPRHPATAAANNSTGGNMKRETSTGSSSNISTNNTNRSPPLTGLSVLQRGRPINKGSRMVSWGDAPGLVVNDSTKSNQQQQQQQQYFQQQQQQQQQWKNNATTSNTNPFGALDEPIQITMNPMNNLSNESLFTSPFLQGYNTNDDDDMDDDNDSFRAVMPSGSSSRNMSPLSNASKPNRIETRQRTYDLNDILRANPLETEAETRILEAIEARDNLNSSMHQRTNGNRDRAGTATSLFSNVTPEGIAIFTSDDDDANNNTKTHGRRASFIENRSIESNHSSSNKAVVSGTSPKNKDNPAPARPRMVARGATVGATNDMMFRHRRNHTMEQKLAGLAEAIADMKATQLEYIGPVASSNQNRPEQARNDDDETVIDTYIPSTTDNFTQNANLIYRGNKIKTSPKVGPHTSSIGSGCGPPPDLLKSKSKDSNVDSNAAQNWAKVHSAIKTDSLKNPKEPIESMKAHRKKTDSGYLEEVLDAEGLVDIEEGNANDENEDDDNNNNDNNNKDNNNNNSSHTASSLNSSDNTNKDDKKKNKKNKGVRKSWLSFGGAATLVPGKVKGAMFDFRVFAQQRRDVFFVYLRLLLLLICPATGVALILFYVSGNPPTGILDYAATAANNGTATNTDGDLIDPTRASASWWIIFICVRLAITFTTARALQVLIIDFLCLSTRMMKRMFGNLVTLFIVQSKGWPFTIFMWAHVNFALLHGTNPLASHWLYWQEAFAIFNEKNPSGNIVASSWNTRILLISIILSFLVAIKRLWLGLFLGKKLYANYAEELAKVMNKILCLCEIAARARELQMEADMVGMKFQRSTVSKFAMSKANYEGLIQRTTELLNETADNSFHGPPIPTAATGAAAGNGRFATTGSMEDSNNNLSSGLLFDPNDIDQLTGGLSPSQRMKLIELLGAWEGPEEEMSVEEDPSISAILQFRNSLSLIDNQFMFSIAWGDVRWRDRMVISSQDVYRRLLLGCPETDTLSFDVIAQTAQYSDGTLDQEKLKHLIRMFRPDRDGKLDLLQFVKSVDTVYKEAKLLRASVRNSEKIDRAFERLINTIFYAVTICIILSQIGFDPLKLFLSLSSIILAFAFMIGTASAKMFEGFLFILIRRPYDIGDRIHVSNIESETSTDGSLGWIVKDVDLFTTTVVFGSTNERATLSNGSIAASRIINMGRSKKAILYIYNKFSTEVPFDKIQIFEEALRKFVRDRPREWASFVSFRATKVMSDLGYVEYVTSLQHRESWQNIAGLLSSKAQVASFCLELAKKLDMRYKSPPLPVDLAIKDSAKSIVQDMTTALNKTFVDPSVGDEVAAMFAIAT